MYKYLHCCFIFLIICAFKLCYIIRTYIDDNFFERYWKYLISKILREILNKLKKVIFKYLKDTYLKHRLMQESYL